MYVLWVNWLPDRRDFQASKYLVAVAARPEGPFQVRNAEVRTAYGIGGDFDVFVDDDGTGYLIYTSLAADHAISIERLARDYLSSTLETTGLLTSGGCFEAPVMFKRAGKYYAMYGACCCFCTEGADSFVSVGSAPMDFSSATPRASIGNAGRAQQNWVAAVPSSGSSAGATYIWIGDRWNSAPDQIKDHDFQYWQPLLFSDNASQPIMPLRWQDEFYVNVSSTAPAYV